jgi:hypothetical protein
MFFGRKGNGVLLSENIRALASAFPRAAAAVEDLYLSACNTAGDIADWPKIFPNLQTIWAYLHTAPSLETGAGTHMRMWDRATRGHQKRIDRLVAKNTGRGENVAVWSRLYGLQPANAAAAILGDGCSVTEPLADARKLASTCPLPPNLGFRLDESMLMDIRAVDYAVLNAIPRSLKTANQYDESAERMILNFALSAQIFGEDFRKREGRRAPSPR